MMQSTSTRAQSRFGGTPNTTISVTEAAIFLSGFYRNEATKTTLKDPRLGLEKPDENNGNASTLIGQAKGVEVQFKEVNQRQQPRDLPVIVLAKDTGGAETLWSPLTETDGSQLDQDAQDFKGEECQIIQWIHLNTANLSKDVCHRLRTAGLCITAVGRSTSGERQDLGNGMDVIGYCGWTSLAVSCRFVKSRSSRHMGADLFRVRGKQEVRGGQKNYTKQHLSKMPIQASVGLRTIFLHDCLLVFLRPVVPVYVKRDQPMGVDRSRAT